MSKLQFPIRIPVGWNLTITQGFHVAAPVDISHALQIQTSDHLGLDVTCGTDTQTFGAACVWPFPFPGVVYDSQAESPIAESNPAHAHAQIDGLDPTSGILYSLIYIHLSAVTNVKDPMDAKTIVYQQGDVIAYIGNSGAVSPAPDAKHPFNGAHLHLGLGVKKPGEQNATMTDPSLYFDSANPFRGADDPTRDKPVYEWAAAHGGGSAYTHNFTADLAYGAVGADVLALQSALQYLRNGAGMPYMQAGVFGPFGPKTQIAMAAFQADHGIADTPPGHHFGPKTRGVMNSLLGN